mgnify:CR=1 FL=1
MLNFLHWIASRHPEIRQLENEPMERLLRLVDEFEGGKLRSNDTLRFKWESGFRFLFQDGWDWEGYGDARRELKRLENQDYGRVKPVNVFLMIDFLRWLGYIHPEIRQLETLPMALLLRLVNEYIMMSHRKDNGLEEWESGFQVLFSDTLDDEYMDARRELRNLEMRNAR